jgi:hypothetical protein
MELKQLVPDTAPNVSGHWNALTIGFGAFGEYSVCPQTAGLQCSVGGFSKAEGWSEQKRKMRGASKSGQYEEGKALTDRGL